MVFPCVLQAVATTQPGLEVFLAHGQLPFSFFAASGLASGTATNRFSEDGRLLPMTIGKSWLATRLLHFKILVVPATLRCAHCYPKAAIPCNQPLTLTDWHASGFGSTTFLLVNYSHSREVGSCKGLVARIFVLRKSWQRCVATVVNAARAMSSKRGALRIEYITQQIDVCTLYLHAQWSLIPRAVRQQDCVVSSAECTT